MMFISKQKPPIFRPSSSNHLAHLSLLLESTREALKVISQLAMVGQELDIGAIDLDTAFLAKLDVFVTTKRGEAPVLADNDLLAAWELVLRAAESFNGSSAVGISRSDRQDDLADIDTGNLAIGLAKGATHASLQTIGSGTGQHLIDADDVVRVGADTHVETFLSGNLDQVLVAADTGGFESFRGQLFVFVGYEMDTGGEFIYTRLLSSKVIDSDLSIWHTTVES